MARTRSRTKRKTRPKKKNLAMPAFVTGVEVKDGTRLPKVES